MNRQPSIYQQAGMTLIELVIAMAITAVIGLIGASMMDGMIKNNSQIQAKSDQLLRFQHSLQVIQNDLDQMVLRIGHSGIDQDTTALMTATQSPVPGLLLEFTRLRSIPSVTPPFEKLERVRYRLDQGSLVRYSSPVAQPATEDQWYKQTLFTDVISTRVYFLFSEWQEELPSQVPQPLRAIRLAIEDTTWQSFELISLLTGSPI